MSVDLNQNNENNVQENIENLSLKEKKLAEMPNSSSDLHPEEHNENQKPLENGATKKEDFPDLKRKKISVEELTWDIENGLRWIRKELNAMREQDKVLTKQLIGMRSKVNEISQMVELDENVDEDEG